MQNLDSVSSNDNGTKMFYFTDEVQSAIEQVKLIVYKKTSFM